MTRLGAEWPLIGREDELRSIAAVLDVPGGAVLLGSAGVGKTRLARAALAKLPAMRVRWLIGTDSARRIPLGAFAPLLGTLPKNADTALRSAREALRDGRTLLAVDDAHLLDDVSATLLHQLATDHRYRMIVTVRTDHQAPDAVAALWKDGLLTRLEIPALTAAHTTTLLERALSGRVERASARRLFTATAGNVLWLRHLVEGERAGGRLRCTAGLWHWVGEPQLSPALTTLIDMQFVELTSQLRHVLELLSLGEPLDIQLLQSLAGADAVEDTADQALMTVVRAGHRWHARLAHPLYGEAVRARMNPMRARRLRGQLARALSSGNGTDDVLRQAVLAMDSDLLADPALFLAAAYRAALLTDSVLAERLGRVARDCGAGFDAQLTLAFQLCWLYRGEEAETEFAAAAALADTNARRLRVAHGRAVNLYFLLAQLDDAQAILTEAAYYTGADLELLGVRALFALSAGRLDEAASAARQALDAPWLSTQAETYAAWALVGVASLTGRGDQVPTVAARGITAARRAPETAPLQLNITWWYVYGLGLAGWLKPVREAVASLAHTFTGISLTVFQPVFEGWLALLTGRVATAVTLLRDFRPNSPGHGGGWTTLLELPLAQAHAVTGDAPGAREALERATVFRHPGVTFIEPQFELTRAWLAAAEGATSTAVQHARRAATMAARCGQYATEVLARHTAVSFGDRAQAFRLAELAQRVEGPRAQAAAAHAAALTTQDPRALLRASAQLAGAELMLPAAEAAAQAATLYRQRGELGPAAPAADRASQLAAACECARTPALLAVAQPLPISERQREIAAMAAQLSNREIAQRLGISVRTVEGHIYHACAKLGLADRAALSALFAPHITSR
jgi:DNA-binding CsgD family transcriptional regulator